VALVWLGTAGGCSSAPLQKTKAFNRHPMRRIPWVGRRRQMSQRVTDHKPPLSGHESCTVRWVKIDHGTGFIDSLCLEDAPYFSRIGDPPNTQKLRSARSDRWPRCDQAWQSSDRKNGG